MVELLRRYSNRSDLLGSLVRTLQEIHNPKPDCNEWITNVQGRIPKTGWRVTERLSEDDVEKLIEAYRGGTTAQALAEQYEVSKSSVKRVLRTHEIRR